jgi:hypothetical protein
VLVLTDYSQKNVGQNNTRKFMNIIQVKYAPKQHTNAVYRIFFTSLTTRERYRYLMRGQRNRFRR